MGNKQYSLPLQYSLPRIGTKKAILCEGTTSTESKFTAGPQLEYSVSLAQGLRTEMEDTACAELGMPEQTNFGCFGIFDGHGGSMVSTYAAQNILKSIRGTEQFQTMINGQTGECDIKANYMVEALPAAFNELDEELRKLKMEEEFKKTSPAFWKKERTSIEMRTVSTNNMGSTATLVLVSPLQFYFCNCGDSRAILVSDGKVSFRTKDHTPDMESEKVRVEQAGGTVMDNRVDGVLAVTRALGDFEFKDNSRLPRHRQKVLAKPDVSVIPRNHKSNEFIVIASDGLWGTCTDEDVAQAVSMLLKEGMTVGQCSDELCKMAVKRGSTDNIGIILIKLQKE